MTHQAQKIIQAGVPSSWLLDALRDRGIGLSDICENLGLNESIFAAPEMILPAPIYDQIFEWGAKAAADPALGIHIAESFRPSQFGEFGYLVGNAPTLSAWIDLIERYHRIYTPHFGVSFRHSGNSCIFNYQPSLLPHSETQQDIDFTLGGFVSGIRQQLNPEWLPIRCEFTYSSPNDMAEHRRFYGQNLTFNQPYNCVEIEEAILTTARVDADPKLLQLVLNSANKLLDQGGSKDDLVRRVRIVITTSLGHDAPNTEMVARLLGLSVRSLHRQLTERGVSFRIIRDDVVHQLAKQALLKTNSSISEIAARLGYGDPSPFIRTFKRLEGTSPLQFRKQCQ